MLRMLFLGVLVTACTTTPLSVIGTGTLSKCPNRPNCVASIEQDPKHHIDPFVFSGDRKRAMAALRDAVTTMGGQLKKSTKTYFHAEFTSSFFRFVDDVEFQISGDLPQIDVRSASRTGYSDLGANRRRVEDLRKSFQSRLLVNVAP